MTPLGAQLPLLLALPKPGTQNRAVYELMQDGVWRTLPEIVEAIGAISEAGVSARLRELDNVYVVPHQKRIRAGCKALREYRLC